MLVYAGFSTTCTFKNSEDAVFGKTSDRTTLQMLLASTNTASIVNTNYLVEHSPHPQVAT